jgi:hypothetical protein
MKTYQIHASELLDCQYLKKMVSKSLINSLAIIDTPNDINLLTQIPSSSGNKVRPTKSNVQEAEAE